MAKKMEEITDESKAMEALGYAPETESVTTETEPEVTTPVEEEVEAEQEVQPEPTQEEKEAERRTFQSEADKAKAEQGRLEEQLRLTQAQNAQLLSMTQRFTEKYSEPEPEKPLVADYLDEDGFIDQAKHDAWLAKRDEQLISKATKRAVEAVGQEKERATVLSQINELVKARPEFLNPLTGKPDIEKIDRAIREQQSSMTISDILGVKKTPGEQQTFKAMEKNANRPSSVVNSQETSEIPKEISGDLKTLLDAFGDVDRPPDY